MFRKASEAYSVLSDGLKRRDYDATRRWGKAAPPPPARAAPRHPPRDPPTPPPCVPGTFPPDCGPIKLGAEKVAFEGSCFVGGTDWSYTRGGVSQRFCSCPESWTCHGPKHKVSKTKVTEAGCMDPQPPFGTFTGYHAACETCVCLPPPHHWQRREYMDVYELRLCRMGRECKRTDFLRPVPNTERKGGRFWCPAGQVCIFRNATSKRRGCGDGLRKIPRTCSANQCECVADYAETHRCCSLGDNYTWFSREELSKSWRDKSKLVCPTINRQKWRHADDDECDYHQYN